MNIDELMQMVGTKMSIQGIASWDSVKNDQAGTWSAHLEGCEAKNSRDDNFISSLSGQGHTPLAAVQHLTARLKGKVLIYHDVVTGRRAEFDVPDSLVAI